MTKVNMFVAEVLFNILLLVTLPVYMGSIGCSFYDLMVYCVLCGVAFVAADDPRYFLQILVRSDVRNYFIVRIVTSLLLSSGPFLLAKAFLR